MRYIITVTIGVLFFAALCLGKDIYVPKDRPTIQGAVDIAKEGDIIIVAPGTYFEELSIGVSLTLKSEGGARRTVIHAEHDPVGYPAVATIVVKSSEPKPVDITIEGFTIQNGRGGISCSGLEGVCRIRNNIILYSHQIDSHYSRGGIYAIGCSDLIISGNIIAFNDSHLRGGGMQILNCDAKIINNTIWGNSCSDLGGGVCIYTDPNLYIDVTLANNIIAGNEAPIGGQIYTKPGSVEPIVTYCCVEGGHVGKGNISRMPKWCGDPEKDLDFHLSLYCSCVDAGSNDFVLDIQDYEGDPRIASWGSPKPKLLGVVDIGADERYKRVYHTGQDAPGSDIRLAIVSNKYITITGFILGTKLLDNPLQCKYGSWWIDHPLLIIRTGWTNGDGIVLLETIVPSLPYEYTVYIQGFALDGQLPITEPYIFYVHL